MANPILAGDILQKTTATPVAGDYLLFVKGSTNGPAEKATVASVVQAITQASATSGTFVATGATPVTVPNANFGASSAVVFTLKTVGGTVGAYPAIQTVTPSTGFTVAATSGDTSTYNYRIL